MNFILFASIFAMLAININAQATLNQDNREIGLLLSILTTLQDINSDITRLLGVSALGNGNNNGFGPGLAAILAATLGRNDDRDDQPSIIKIPSNSYGNTYGRVNDKSKETD